MNMSEKFDLPVDCYDSGVKLLNGITFRFVTVEGANGQIYNKYQDAEYVTHAINSHDGLVEHLRLKEEECKQLSQDKAELVDTVLELISKSDCCIDLLNCSEERYLDYSSVKSVALKSVEKHQ